MKRAMPWSDEEEDSSEESSSHSDNESDDGVGKMKEKTKSRNEQSSKGTNFILPLPFLYVKLLKIISSSLVAYIR